MQLPSDKRARKAASPSTTSVRSASPAEPSSWNSRPAARRGQVRDFLLAIPFALVIVPGLFWVRFGVIDEFGWGLTVFLVVLCALGALGVWSADRLELHTPVQARGGLGDAIGGFWLLACAFGPLTSWFFEQTQTLTDDTWRVILAVQLALCAGLPLVTMVPNLRYARGGSRGVALAILFGVTALPVGASYNHWRDLRAGPVARRCVDGSMCQVLPHSGRLVR